MRMLALLAVLTAPLLAADNYPILVYPAPKAAAAPTIDGRLDDACWQGAPVVSGFIWYNGAEIANVQTSFRVCWDAQALYLAVWCDEPMIDKLVAQPQARDATQIFNTEAIEVFLDPKHNHRDYYQFAFNAAASTYDSRQMDTGWDGKSTAAAAKGDHGWALEVRFPWAPMDGYAAAAGQVVGLNVCRDRTLVRDREWSCWSQVNANFHDPDRFGHIVLAPSADQLAGVGPEVRKGERSGPLRIFTVEGVGGATYQAMAKKGLARVDTKLRELKRAGRKEGPAIAQAMAGRLAKFEAQVEKHRQAVAQPLDGAAFARMEHDLSRIERELDGVLWDARLEGILSTL